MSAAEILQAIFQKTTNTKLFYAADGANKGMNHLIKIVTFFSRNDIKL